MSVGGGGGGGGGRAAGKIVFWGARRCLVPCGFCGSLGAFGACLMLSLWLGFLLLGVRRDGRGGVDGLDGGGNCSGLSLVYFGRAASSEAKRRNLGRIPHLALNQP